MTVQSRLVTTDPQCVTLHDAIATPFELVPPADRPDLPVHPSFKSYTRGCLYQADGVRLDLSMRIGGIGGDQAKSIDPAILEQYQLDLGPRLAGRTLYLGTFMNHYGHFITETLSRCWWREAAIGFDHIVAYPFMHNHGRVLTRGYHRYLAGLLDLPIDRVEILTEQTRFDEIVVPEQLWVSNLHVNAHMREIYGRIGRHHVGGKSCGRIFLSRTTATQNRLSNAQEVEDVFAGHGFRVLYPEQIPIAEQLRLYANCEILAGLSGSGMHNCLFARPGLMTIEVGDTRSRRQPLTMQQMANEVAQVDARFIPFGKSDKTSIAPRKVKKHLLDFLGERPTLGPMLALRLQRKAKKLHARFKAWRKKGKRARM